MSAARAAILAAAVFMVVATSARYLDRPLRFDEAEFARMARDGVLRHGVPMIPPADQRWIRHDPRIETALPRYGMWHPPLYMYTLAAAAAVTPPANWPLRGAGLFCLLASLVLAWRLVDVLAPDLPRGLRAVPLALALLSPLVVEGALFIDIDGTVMPVVILLFLERWLAWRRDLTVPRIAVLGALFALCLSAKMTTPILAVTAMGAHLLLEDRRWRSLASLVAIALTGMFIFAAAYLGYCAATGYPAGYMLELYGARGGALAAKPAALRALALRWNLAWISPALAVLLLLHGAERAWTLVRGLRRADGADLLWMFAALNAMAYVLTAAYWGKYMAPGTMVGALGAGTWIARGWRASHVTRPIALATTLAGLACLAAALASPREQIAALPASFEAGWADPRTAAVLLLALSAGAIALASRWMIQAPSRAAAAAIALVFCVGLTSVIEQARVIFSSADNGPLRAGQERGFAQVVERLNALGDQVIILAPKDVGFYYRGRSFTLEDARNRGAQAALEIAARPEVRVIVDTIQRPMIPDPARVPPAAVEEIGTFRLYVKR